MRPIRLSSLAIALALVACSPPASNTGNSGQTAQGPSASAPASAPGSQLRLGRWNKTMTVMGRTTTEAECVTTADLNQLAHDPSSRCTSPNGFQRTADGLVYEAECTGEGGGGHIRTVMTGDLQNHYSVDSTMSGTGEASAMQVQIHIDGTYEGACHGDE